MKDIFIDDIESFADKFCIHFNNNEDIILSNPKSDSINLPLEIDISKNPNEIAQAIFQSYLSNEKNIKPICNNEPLTIKVNGKVALIAINIEGKFGRTNRQNQRGVEIAMWLRCKYRVCNPIIFYSFQNVHQLLNKRSDHLIITSEGCYHFQLPFDFSKFRDKSFKSVTDWNNLKKYLKPALNIEEFRHNEANWWGVYRLNQIHSITNPSNGVSLEKLTLPRILKQKIESLNSEIAKFIYDFDINIDREKLVNKFEKATNILNMFKELKPAPKIIYIDDQANIGWSDILQQVIYGKNDEKNFITFSPDSSTDIEKLSKDVLDNIRNNQPINLIILDLRLKGETGNINDLKNLSGIKVFFELREKYKFIPILIITASNKSKTYTFLYNNKQVPQGYWIKEGIDNEFSTEESLENYISLINQLYKLIESSIKKYYYKVENKSFENEQRKKEEYDKVSRGFYNIITKTKDGRPTNTWLAGKIDSYCPLKDVNFELCVVDTNYFLHTKDEVEVIDYTQTFLLFSDFCSIKNIKLGIHINVYAEIIKFGMFFSSTPISKAARNYHKILKDLNREKKSSFIYDDRIDWIKIITGEKIYADDLLTDYCIKSSIDKKSILFISKDTAENGPIDKLKKFTKANPPANDFITIRKPGYLVDEFRQIVKVLREECN